MFENVAAGYEGDPDFFIHDSALSGALFEGAANASLEQPSVRELVTGLLRVGAAAMIICILTGVRELGIGVAVVGTAWLYYHT